MPYSRDRRRDIYLAQCVACGFESREPPHQSAAVDAALSVADAGLFGVAVALVYIVLAVGWVAAHGLLWLPFVVGLPVAAFAVLASLHHHRS